MPSSMYALAILTAISLAIGQLLFKIGAGQLNTASVSEFLGSALLNPILIGAVALYGATILVWIYVLSKMPLSIAYPITGLAYIIVPILSYYILDEKMNLMLMAGSFFIFIGISLVARSSL